MTYSIVAWDPSTGMTGVAVATKHLAVGSLVPHARAGVGAVATQSATNPLLGPWGLDRLEQLRGSHQPVSVARTVRDSLVHDDPGRDLRQFHLVDAEGRTAGWTGRCSAGWAGHRCFRGFSVAGNYLAGPAPLESMAAAYRQALARDLPFVERLMLSLEACEEAGGDHRGRQSAAIYVMHRELYPLHDYRVDHHPEPLAALREILRETSKPYFLEFRSALPVAAPATPAGIDLLPEPALAVLPEEPVSADSPAPLRRVVTPTPVQGSSSIPAAVPVQAGSRLSPHRRQQQQRPRRVA